MLYAIDIGSTIIKLFQLDEVKDEAHKSYDRDYSIQVSQQVEEIIRKINTTDNDAKFRICSSANGGLSIGIISLSIRFSGQVVNNLAAAAGANVLYLQTFSDNYDELQLPSVDVLIVTGGIDCEEASELKKFIKGLDISNLKYQMLVYAGNSYLCSYFSEIFPNAISVENPIDYKLHLNNDALLTMLRNMYLEDLIEKEGVSSLQKYSEYPIWPTPAIVNMAFHVLSLQKINNSYPSPFIIIDIGGATTDIHFGLELVHEGIGESRNIRLEDNRYVFTELGVSASKSNTLHRLSHHPGLFDFLSVFSKNDVNDLYHAVMDGNVTKEIMFSTCLYLALDSMIDNEDEAVPHLNLGKVEAIVITGGASQCVKIDDVEKTIKLVLSRLNINVPNIFIDNKYCLWTIGMKYISDYISHQQKDIEELKGQTYA